mmetsp:Transcript_70644/g.197368  ORF Transcript_70644/g.197368 Transcript_70644/m.197368 type:complete len:156 (-) Transcript_70644:206-673(-)
MAGKNKSTGTFDCLQTVGLQLRFFCGVTRKCREYSIANLAVARSNIQRNFVAVLVVEEMLLSFTVLERKLPGIFTGMTDKYKHPRDGGDELRSRINFRTVNEKETLDIGARTFLEKELALEYDLYDFAVKRLNDQASACGIVHEEGQQWKQGRWR